MYRGCFITINKREAPITVVIFRWVMGGEESGVRGSPGREMHRCDWLWHAALWCERPRAHIIVQYIVLHCSVHSVTTNYIYTPDVEQKMLSQHFYYSLRNNT